MNHRLKRKREQMLARAQYRHTQIHERAFADSILLAGFAFVTGLATLAGLVVTQ